jgi:hypothetical protein
MGPTISTSVTYTAAEGSETIWQHWFVRSRDTAYVIDVPPFYVQVEVERALSIQFSEKAPNLLLVHPGHFPTLGDRQIS